MPTNQYKGIHSFHNATLVAGAPQDDDAVVTKGYVSQVIAEAIESLGGQLLPEVTAADNGKILRVIDGVWTAVRAALASIAITTPPTKVAYAADEVFDATDMVVTATFVDSSTAVITDYTYTPAGALATTDTKITVSYTENGVTKTAEQAITVT